MNKETETELNNRKYSVPAVENAFEILKLLSRKQFSESTVTEISNALSLNAASCFRILHILEELAVVRYKKDNKRYTLGPYLIAIGNRAKEHLDYIAIVQPHLRYITEKTGLTSVLISKVGDDRLTIVSKEEAADFSVHVSIGRHFSITDGAYGKCFLAHLEKEEREFHLKEGTGLRDYSDIEITQLEAEFEQIRQVGYSITFGEYIKGIFGIAAPIFNDQNNTEISISVIGMTAQIDKEEELMPLGDLVKSAANEITEAIKAY